MDNFIEFQNVTKEYSTSNTVFKALDDISFTIDKKEFVVILGPSGSGKSTLLNLLGGLDTLTRGDIIVNNQNISKYTDKQLTQYRADKLGFIFQFYNLIPNLTAIENVDLINDVIDKKINAMEVLKKVNLDTHANKFPSELSGGEQQRVSIARAISKNPDMLLCDEPTGALDSKTGVNVIKLLYDLCKKDNTTVIIVTHNELLSKIADKIINLKNGRIESIKINGTPTAIDEIDW